MKALIKKSTNKLEQFVESSEGYDLDEYDVIEFEGHPLDVEYNGSTIVSKPRPEKPVKLKEEITLQNVEERIDNAKYLKEIKEILKFICSKL
jgi:hypothetical protein